jgi:hypothetical protein
MPSASSRIIYVDATNGNDATGSPTTLANQPDPFQPDGNELPYQTIAAGLAQMRDGFPDWLLLKRGQEWEESILFNNKSGKSPQEPFFVGCYGESGSRPLLKTGNDSGVMLFNLCENFIFYGIEAYCNNRDPLSPTYAYIASNAGQGFVILGGGDSITIEDCKVSFYRDGISAQSTDGLTRTNLTIKNNIIIDSYGSDTSMRSQGVFFNEIVGIVFENNLIDHCGWNESVSTATATIFNHGAYIQDTNTGCYFRNNITSRNSTHGLMGRPGGLYENNLSIQDTIGIFLGSASDSIATCRYCVVTEGRDMDLSDANPQTSAAIYGVEVGDNELASGSVIVEDNLILNALNDDNNIGIVEASNPLGIIYSGNVKYNWRGSDGDSENPGWTDATKTLSTFMASLSETPTTEAFINKHRNRGLGENLGAFSASAVNNYLRAGFDMEQV